MQPGYASKEDLCRYPQDLELKRRQVTLHTHDTVAGRGPVKRQPGGDVLHILVMQNTEPMFASRAVVEAVLSLQELNQSVEGQYQVIISSKRQK